MPAVATQILTGAKATLEGLGKTVDEPRKFAEVRPDTPAAAFILSIEEAEEVEDLDKGRVMVTYFLTCKRVITDPTPGWKDSPEMRTERQEVRQAMLGNATGWITPGSPLPRFNQIDVMPRGPYEPAGPKKEDIRTFSTLRFKIEIIESRTGA